MAKQECVLLIIFILCSTLSVVVTDSDGIKLAAQKTIQDVTTPEIKRTSRNGCTSCSVKGQIFDGHSRFQFDEGCSRFRCVCRCNGSWECPTRHVVNLCEQTALTRGHRQAGSDSSSTSTLSSSAVSSSSRNDLRCMSCVINGKEYQGHSRFTYTHECLTITNCVCYCNGSWFCPQEITASSCNEGNSGASREDNKPVNIAIQPEELPGSSNNCSSNCSHSNSSNEEMSKEDSNRAQETRRLRLYASECQDCKVGKKIIKGNNYFELVEGCYQRKYCTCYCNGTWKCPERFVENICEPDDHTGSRGQSVGCRSCDVKNNTFQGNRYFQVTDGCIEYRNCICYCDGTWNCPKAESINKCAKKDDRDVGIYPSDICKQCEVQDQVFPGNQYFQFIDRCSEYSNCICRCNGSWSCPQENVKNVCLQRGSQVAATTSCQGCEVYGSNFPGNNYFQFKQGCLEYSNCVCYCNGSWSCPADSARNACDREGSTYLGLSEDGAGNASRTRCSNCLVYGKYFKGGDYFDVTDGCTSYRKCICRCDGSWDCINRFAVDICSHGNITSKHARNSTAERGDTKNIASSDLEAKQTDNQCSFCDAREKVVTGNSYFNLTDGCVEYKNCLCRCDGSWECPPHFAKNICPEGNQTAGSGISSLNTCSNCVARGKIITGDSDFELVDGCTMYPSCRCHCNGLWYCSDKQTKNICLQNITTDAENCSMCESSDGVVHPPNSRFRLTEECVEHTCMCFCNGSWNCPEHENRWVCQNQCLNCDVDGRIFKSNAQFVHKAGCLEYTCSCHCNGTWSCQDNTIRDMCRAVSSDGCNKCSVSTTEVYDGESDFVLEQGCLHYKCRCNCDGSYVCPGKKARNLCRGEALGSCRSCVVSETEIYKGGTSFAMRKGCIYYDCKCKCDGSWSCASENARNVCLGEVPGGCRVCRLFESHSFRAGSVFDMRQGCINYKCKCNCDGGWFCPGKDARDTCKGEVPGGCRSCVISELEFFPGASNFEMVRNCVRYQCRCNCDGSYNCPGNTARRICGNSDQPVAVKCKSCKVSAAEEFDGNTRFYMQRNCSSFECMCKCDGSWECPPENTRDVCRNDRSQAPRLDSCRSCRISKYVFPGSSVFKFNNGCFQFDCVCECSGKWSCDKENPINICRELEQTITERPLISDTSAARKVNDITAASSLNVAAQTSLSGTTFDEPDIHVQDVTIPQVEHIDRVDSTVGSEASVYNNITISRCRPCYADDRRFAFEDTFSIDRGCVQYKNCRCYCNGRWQCADVSNVCEERHISTFPPGKVENRTEKQYFGLKEQLRMKEATSESGSKDNTDRVPEASEDTATFLADQGIVYRHDSSRVRKETASPERRYNGEFKKQESDICHECDVRGVIYPAGSKFFIQDGCHERVCECHCNKSWSCDSSVNICKSKTKQIVDESECKDCRVESDIYISGKDFQINNDCFQHNCHCFCNGTYRCPDKLIRNNCPPNIDPSVAMTTKDSRHLDVQIQTLHLTKENGDVIMPDKVPGCKDCHMNRQKIPTLSTFVKQIGCYTSLCFCQCNGRPACAPSTSVNVCKMADRKLGHERKGCRIGPRTHFTRLFAHVENCIQRACVCHDDGQWFCKRTLHDRQVC